jgi:hypothetical protein
VKEHDLIKGKFFILGIYLIVRGSGTETTSSQDILFKEKKGKYDVISYHSIAT